MSTALAERIGRIYSLASEGDRALFDFLAPDVEWHWPPAIPGGSSFRGHDELARGLELWTESWGEFRMEPDEIIESGEYVFVLSRYRLRGAGSGVPMDPDVGHVLRFGDGLVTHWWMFGDAEKARRRFLAGDRPG